MRNFSKSVTLLLPEGSVPTTFVMSLRRRGTGAFAPVAALRQLGDGFSLNFDVMYPILGYEVCSELATRLGASRTKVGCLVVDEHARAS
jgi:thioredoxin reductase (NADPH)